MWNVGSLPSPRKSGSSHKPINSGSALVAPLNFAVLRLDRLRSESSAILYSARNDLYRLRRWLARLGLRPARKLCSKMGTDS